MAQAAERPFEGRERELDLLLERWQLARDGAGQVALVSAGAGIGKTRLVEEFAQRTAGAPRALLLCRCSRLRRLTAFSPLVDLLQRLERAHAGRGEDDPAADRPAAGADSVARLRATLVARLSSLLAAPRQHRKTALNLQPEGRSRKILEEIHRLFLEVAKRLPVLLVIEDLDWADPSTLELLSLLIHRRPRVHWMTVLTFGPEFEPTWDHRAYILHLEPPPLSRRQEEVLLDRLAAGRPLEPELRTRLDNETRNVASLAAVLGEELSLAQLRAFSALGDAELERALERLVTTGILIRPGPAGDFAFRHSLIREALHDSLIGDRRRQAHARAAEILERSFSQTTAREPELLAYHYGEAGMPSEAATAWRQAAEQAVRSSANLEAAGRARRGIEGLESVTGDDTRRSLEIGLQTVLGAALGTAKGFAAAEAEAAYGRALDLAWQAPPSAEQFPALQELTSYYLSRGQVSTACEVAERAVRAIGDDASESLSDAQRALGFAQLLGGDFTGAEVHLEKSLAPYAVHRSLLPATPPALGIPLAETLSHMALAEWFLGRPSRALKHSTDSLNLARRFNDPYCRVFTIYRASFFHVFRREPAVTRELAHELVGLANRHGFLFFIAAGMFLEGQALAAQGRAAEGLQMMTGGLDGVWASGMEVGRPRNLALLAEACGKSELFEQGLSLVKEGIAAVEITGEGHYEAELFRIQGELLRHSGGSEAEIEDSFLQALGLARSQGTTSLELRAAMSLSRLRQAQGKLRPAGELLAEVYGKFDEGFDTADLREAKELLDELA